MKKYNIGLDIGTNSVGWAVVESETQKIIRKGNKNLWGVRLFKEASTAAERRRFRSARRRYERRRNRIKYLQEEFKNEINKIDPNFFTKLNESFYHEDDEVNKTIKLSQEEKEQIKKYQQKYKTIYHLREELITNTEKKDIRLVYLAIHHIIKYRGNFLYKLDKINSESLNIEEKIIELLETLKELCPNISIIDEYEQIINIKELSEKILEPSKNDRKIYLQKYLSEITTNKNFINEFVKMINSNNFNIIKMLEIENDEEKIEISFNGTDYEDKYDDILKCVGNKIEVIEAMKELYDMIFLKRLFKGSKTSNLSGFMLEKYKIHEEDLKFLKKLFKSNKEIYKKIFKTKNNTDIKNACLYDRYIKNNITYDEFKKEIEKNLLKIFDENIIDNHLKEQYETNIKIRLENGDFLPRITEKDNGKFPYQLNKEELMKIIENQGTYYPFLLDKVNDEYKIVKLLKFRIPYYVGPLTDNEKQSEFAWLIKKQDIKITPYNFEEVIDKEQTAEKFIKKMISHCTYILDEPAMPNNSILYSEFKVRNELKQIKINGAKLSNEMQQKIIEELFKKTNETITDKKFKEYLHSIKDFDMYGTELDIKGYSADEKFSCNLSSYFDFFGPNGIFENTNYGIKDAENIIEWITIFEDKEILESKVRNEYSEISENHIKQILSKKYSGWSSLSKKLLIEKYYIDKRTGIEKSIMDLMQETDENFMQIINNKEYNFQKMISDYNNQNTDKKINYKLVENLATSPATKRGIYQALKIVSELTDYMGYDPESIVIEMARENDNSGRKDDRKNYLIKLYETNKNQIDEYNKLMKELKNFEKIDSQKLFLYFIQEGKSLYSGKPLNIEDLDSYEIDHIIPRTLIKDDSIDNKALVFREENQNKGASYVLPIDYIKHNKEWWNKLKKLKLISARKHYNLTRKEYKNEDIEGFINRQLVETRQITKHIANILGEIYSNTKIIYLKANLSHNYREKYELYKFRDINNYHHAHDAYLAAVLGEYKEKYLRKNINFELIKELNTKLRENKEYKSLKYGYVINSLDPTMNNLINDIIKTQIDNETGEVLFNADEFNKRVENTLYRNDILVSRKTEIRNGEFYNQSKNKKGNIGVSLKNNLPIGKYGSYSRLNPAYAIVVKFSKKGKEEQRLIGLPIYILSRAKKDKYIKEGYIRNLLNLMPEDYLEISNKKIPFYSLLDWNGQICYLVGASDKVEVCNGKEFYFDKTFLQNNNKTLNILLNKKNIKEEEKDNCYEKELGEIIKYIVEKIEKEYILYQNLITELKEMIHYENLDLLKLEEKEKVIIELLNLLKCNSQNANFKFLSNNYSSAFGKKNGRIINNGTIIYKSITGIKEVKYEF